MFKQNVPIKYLFTSDKIPLYPQIADDISPKGRNIEVLVNYDLEKLSHWGSKQGVYSSISNKFLYLSKYYSI